MKAALFIALLTGVLLCALPARAQQSLSGEGAAPNDDSGSEIFIQIEGGASLARFHGGGASAAGPGAMGALSVLLELGESGLRFGPRAAWTGFRFEDVGGFPGSELREQLITVGVLAELPMSEFLALHAHWGIGGAIVRAKSALPVPARRNEGGLASELGAGVRLYPARHVYFSTEFSVSTISGPAADLVDVSYRGSALLGLSF